MKPLRSSVDTAPDVPPTSDRRRGDRIALRIPVRVFTYSPTREKSEDAICTDLCEGGMAFETPAQLNIGEVVIVEFQLKGETPYRCHARLTYRMGCRYGGYFLGGR
ncbi:MAG TPA: PilZ domain-containing protein [Terriglobales bacterium]|nr:PilZ domain-containing protein [Terriglobales bacterium]